VTAAASDVKAGPIDNMFNFTRHKPEKPVNLTNVMNMVYHLTPDENFKSIVTYLA
jgi:hypothetical protein